MRIFIVDTYYPAFLKSHYDDRPELADAPYDTQWRALMDRFFGTSDAYSHFLGELGHEAHEVVLNCDQLQRAWALEHGVTRKRRVGHQRDLSPLLEQAEKFRPDVIYVQDLNVLAPNDLRKLRRRCAAVLVGQIASKTPSRSRLEEYDLLVTAAPHFVEHFREAGYKTEFIRLGFDPRVSAFLGPDLPRTGVAFVGAVGRSPTWKSNALLERAARRAPIDFWGYKVGRLPLSRAVKRRYHGEAWGLDMYRVLTQCKIALNRHGGVAGDHAINMRLYEATGAGALLITDAKSDLSDILVPDQEVVTYSTEDELVDRIRYYLANDTQRDQIARAGQERTLRDHTSRNRIRELAALMSHLRDNS